MAEYEPERVTELGPGEDSVKALRWQCRRGMKEVEVLLNPFLENRYAALADADRQLFRQLLAQPDIDLFDWFVNGIRPNDAELARMVQMICARSMSE